MATAKIEPDISAAAVGASPAMSVPSLKRHQHWGVTVDTGGEEIVRIETGMLSGREISEADEDAIRQAARHLLGFIGDSEPSPPASDGTAALREALEMAAKVLTDFVAAFDQKRNHGWDMPKLMRVRESAQFLLADCAALSSPAPSPWQGMELARAALIAANPYVVHSIQNDPDAPWMKGLPIEPAEAVARQITAALAALPPPPELTEGEVK